LKKYFKTLLILMGLMVVGPATIASQLERDPTCLELLLSGPAAETNDVRAFKEIFEILDSARGGLIEFMDANPGATVKTYVDETMAMREAASSKVRASIESSALNADLEKVVHHLLKKVRISNGDMAWANSLVSRYGNEHIPIPPLSEEKYLEWQFRFRSLAGLRGRSTGVLAEIAGAILLNAEQTGKRATQILGKKTQHRVEQKGFPMPRLKRMEIDLVSENGTVWTEVKTWRPSPTVDDPRALHLLKQVAVLARLRDILSEIGTHIQLQVLLVTPTVDPELLEKIKATNTRVLQVHDGKVSLR
jgi:hypothetical protein